MKGKEWGKGKKGKEEILARKKYPLNIVGPD